MKNPITPRPRRRDLRATIATATAALLLAACTRAGGSVAATPSPAPAKGPRVVLPSGKTIVVEVAKTPEETAQGLMFRESMPEGNGMVFLFTGEEIRPFWMKNCHFPLDMIYTKKDGTVVDILANVPPCAADPCPSYPPKAKADTVVEINGGLAARNGVTVGSKISYRDVPER